MENLSNIKSRCGISILLAASVALFAVLPSCSKSGKISTISYDFAMGQEVGADFSELFEYVDGFQIEESDSTMFNFISVCGILGDNVVLDGRGKICTIDGRGKAVSIFSRKGRGPQEYLSIASIDVDESEGTVYVQDISEKKRILKYSLTGDFRGEFPLKRTPSGILLNNGCLYTANLADSASRYSVYSMDSMELIAESSALKKRPKTAIIYSDKIFSVGESVLYQMALTDTVYRLCQDRMEPFLHIDFGKYEMPIEYRASLDLLDKYSPSYMPDYYYMMSSEYLFAEYLYGNKMYYDIWKYKEGKLIYHHIVDEENFLPGFPFNVGGQIVYSWPKYIQSDTMICEVYPLGEDGPFWSVENNNPALLRLKIK